MGLWPGMGEERATEPYMAGGGDCLSGTLRELLSKPVAVRVRVSSARLMWVRSMLPIPEPGGEMCAPSRYFHGLPILEDEELPRSKYVPGGKGGGGKLWVVWGVVEMSNGTEEELKYPVGDG